MDLRQKLFQEISCFSEKYFKHRDYFVCVYGSFASGDYTKTSDIDVFVAIKIYDERDFKEFRDFLVGLHIRYGLNQDNEVPYWNKLLVSYEDVQQAIDLSAFIKKESGYHAPVVKKNKEFLASLEIRWRLILNALTSPHECLCGNKESYSMYRTNAEKSIMRLARGLIKTEKPTQKELLDVLVSGANGEEGEMYLGYKKECDSVIEYLEDILRRYYSDEFLEDKKI